MPLLDSTLAQVIFAFAMIGLFAFVLRWTFSRDGKDEPPALSDTSAGISVAGDTVTGDAGTPDTAASGDTTAIEPTPTAPVAPLGAVKDAPAPASSTADADDYGLLRPAAIVDTEEQAARIRDALGKAGIRATTTIGADGRRRVLVFTRDLHHARRVAGSAT